MALLTLTTLHSAGIGGFPKCLVHHSLKASLMYKYSGAFGGGASANALVTSAPVAIRPSSATIDQNRQSLAASSALVYVCPRVTVPF